MIKRKVTTDWIIKQIRSGKAYRFYLTANWAEVRDRKKHLNIMNVNAVARWVNIVLVKPCITSYTSRQDLILLSTSTTLNVFAKIATTKNITNINQKNKR